MNRFFGSGGGRGRKAKDDEPPPPTLDDASKKMDSRAQSLEEKVRRLDAQILDVKKKMQKSRGASKKRYQKKALQLLKQRKMYEKQLDSTMNQQFNLDQAKFTTESLAETGTMVAAMKTANQQIQAQYKEIDIDEIEDLQDEMADLMADAEEIQEVMGRTYGMDDFDEDDLLDELNELEDEMAMFGDEDELPDYLTNSNANTDTNTNQDQDLDEYGLPKVAQTMTL